MSEEQDEYITHHYCDPDTATGLSDEQLKFLGSLVLQVKGAGRGKVVIYIFNHRVTDISKDMKYDVTNL